MSHYRIRDYHDRRTLIRVTSYRVAVAAAGLTLLGTVAVLPSAAASSTRAVPKVDHQLCYAAKAKGFRIPTGVVLKNQFNPRGFPVRIGPAVAHCNPVVKIIPGPAGPIKFPVTNPAAHLACFRITAPKQPTPLVLVQNQFGEADLNVGPPVLLCLPSWKRIAGPPHTRAVQPPGLSHFTCYAVRVQQGSYTVPKGIMLRDEFARRPVPVQVNNVPVLLCLPTVKIVHGHVTRIVNPRVHLLCFPVSKTPIRPRVFDKNQFGTAVVQINRTAISRLLCLPSTKQVLHP